MKLKKKAHAVLYDSYFINFPSLFLNGFIIFFPPGLGILEGIWCFVCLWVVLFCWNHFARGGNGRKEDVNGNHVMLH